MWRSASRLIHPSLPLIAGQRYLGEYQDTYEYDNTWFASAAYNPQNANSDIYLLRVAL